TGARCQLEAAGHPPALDPEIPRRPPQRDRPDHRIGLKAPMTQPEANAERGRVVGLQERRLGRTVLRTYRTKADIDDIVPNPRQPRLGPKEYEELQRQIEANEGLFEPLLVEPHPDLPGKFRIIDGDRRWTNCAVLVNTCKTQYRYLPVEITDRTLSDEERLRAWLYIHHQRK